MTQPPYYNPVEYAYASTATAPTRPTSVTVLAIIGIVWGALSLVCIGANLCFGVVMLTNGGRNPMAPQLAPIPANVTWYNVAVGAIYTISAVILLIASIRALALRAAAYRVLMIWSIAIIGFATVTSIIAGVWVIPQTVQTLQKSKLPGLQGSQFASIQHVSMVFGVIFGWLMHCALPVCFLILWRRPVVRTAFHA